MDDENAAGAAAGDGFDEMENLALILLVNGEAVFDGHGDIARRLLHRAQALGDQRRVVHQTSTNAVVLHAVAGAADVKIYLLIAIRQGDFAGARQRFRLAAAQLQGAGRVRLVLQMAFGVAVNERASRHHLRIKQGAAGKKAVQRATFRGCPIQHRRHAKTVWVYDFKGLHKFLFVLIGYGVFFLLFRRV